MLHPVKTFKTSYLSILKLMHIFTPNTEILLLQNKRKICMNFAWQFQPVYVQTINYKLILDSSNQLYKFAMMVTCSKFLPDSSLLHENQ
ncbi:hypothetical protein Hanom_Chr09g00869751 [Helianthus anomalus]